MAESDQIPASFGHGGCCGRGGLGAGILWNDAGHRTQVERAIWILAAADPAGEFFSFWAIKAFRDGFHKGLWDADYRSPHRNYGDLILYKGGFFTSHFWNPSTQNHYGHDHALTRAFRSSIEEFDKHHAVSAAVEWINRAVDKHDHWRDGERTPTAALRMGYYLGLALHYVTDLTQPMHAANFTNVFGGPDDSPNKDDFRHAAFENLADHFLDPGRSERVSLLQDPATARMVFANGLQAIVESTATDAKGVFLARLQSVLKEMASRGQWDTFPEPEGLTALQAALPLGQRNTALVLHQWARLSNRAGARLRSDWVAVTERKDATRERLACMFYRRDGDLHPVFRFQDRGEWREDANPAFAEFAGAGINSARAFAAAYDEGAADHPALFIANDEGQLFYFEAAGNPRQWTKSEPILGSGVQRVAGSIVATYDERYGKPSAFYRAWDGVLHYVVWDKAQAKFVVYPMTDFPRVGGAMSVVWDPTDCGLGDGKGHTAVAYVRGDGAMQYLRVRGGGWKSLVFEVDAESKKSGAHAHPQMAAAAYEPQSHQVVVFWGRVRYVKKMVPESKDPVLYYWEQQPAELLYTHIPSAGEPPATHVLRHGGAAESPDDGSAGEALAVGGIGAGSKPRLTVHFQSAEYRNESQMRVMYERTAQGFKRSEFPSEQVFGPIAVVNSAAATIVGYRQVDRQCFVAEFGAAAGASNA